MLTHTLNALLDISLRRLLYRSVVSLLFSIAIVTSALAIDPSCVARVDWTTLPSTFTHDANGIRVDRYAEGIEPVSNERPDYQRSGFRHTRSTLQAGNSVDNFHVVDRWGPSVQPYGEWRYPYRPYSVPYGAWGPQSPLVNVQQSNAFGSGYPGFPPSHPGGGNAGFPPNGSFGSNNAGGFPGNGFGPGGFGAGNPGRNGWNQNGWGVGPNNALRPDQDDYYPAAPEPPPVSDRDFFFVPERRTPHF